MSTPYSTVCVCDTPDIMAQFCPFYRRGHRIVCVACGRKGPWSVNHRSGKAVTDDELAQQWEQACAQAKQATI